MPPYAVWSRPRVEALEDRCLLTTYTVTTVKDLLGDVTPGEVTLRDVLTAISTQARSGNALAGTASNTVRFAIGAPGSVQTINVGGGNVAGPLPALTRPALIDGWSQGGATYAGPPLIVLNGAAAGAGADGLELAAGSNGSQARGLVVQQFGDNGIEVNGSGGDVIRGNYLGTDAAGTSSQGNGNDGILLDGGASRDTVSGNVISGNGNGLELTGAGTTANVVVGNLIGTDHTGRVALGNVGDGILIDGGARANTVGGITPGSANVICGGFRVSTSSGGSSQAGAVFALSPATITGNVARFDVEVAYSDTPPSEMVYLGLDLSPTSAALTPLNPATGQPDFSAFDFVPSGTLGPGWARIDSPLANEFLYHTPPPPGTQPPSGLRPNATYLLGTLTYDLSKFGIAPSSSLDVSIAGTDTTIGTEQPGHPPTFDFVNPSFAGGQQSVQAGPSSAGVEVRDGGTSGNVVVGNLVGTDKTGTAALGHLTDGVLIDGGATRNTAAANVVGGNDDGVVVSGAGTSNNAVQGNRIGTDARATTDLGNTLAGVLLENGATADTVGGTAPGSGNVIAYNDKGVVIGGSASDAGTTHDSVLGNTIFANAGLGIDLGNGGVAQNGTNPRAFPNDGQNFPVITALTPQSVSGTLTSVPQTAFRIELFALPAGGLAGRGQFFLGALNVMTAPAGTAGFTLPLAALPLGTVVTATATNLSNGDTSAFAPVGTQLVVFSNPVVTSAGAPQVVTLSAQIFSGTAPVVRGPVTFTIAGLPGRVTATPNAAGVVTVSFVLPAWVAPGQYVITATFPDEEGFPGARGSYLLTVLSAPPSGGVARRWLR